MSSTCKNFQGPRTGAHSEVDDVVAEFLTDLRNKKLPVSRKVLMKKSLEEAERKEIENFKASEQWCNHFMKRYGFALHCWTSVCQRLLADFEEKLVSFQR